MSKLVRANGCTPHHPDPDRPRMRYTGYIVLKLFGDRQSACPRISSNDRASVRAYCREHSLWIKQRAAQ